MNVFPVICYGSIEPRTLVRLKDDLYPLLSRLVHNGWVVVFDDDPLVLVPDICRGVAAAVCLASVSVDASVERADQHFPCGGRIPRLARPWPRTR